MGLRGLSACSKIKDGGERAQSSHSPTLDRLLASSLLALCFSWPRGPGGQAMMDRNAHCAQRGGGGWSWVWWHTCNCHTRATGAEGSQHQLPSQFQISLPYLGACWEKEVPVINSYICQEKCSKQLSRNECPEKDQGEQSGEGQTR